MTDTSTRARIVKAAIDVFLEKGYNSSTIRDICTRAGANMAAVNDHFGSKESLRAATLEYVMSSCNESYPFNEGLSESKTPEDRLHRFISNMVRLMFPPDEENARQTQLLWFEMGNPSPALQSLLERFLTPITDELKAILLSIAPKLATDELQLFVNLIIGQCVFYGQNQFIISKMLYDSLFCDNKTVIVSDFIYKQSLSSLQAYKK